MILQLESATNPCAIAAEDVFKRYITATFVCAKLLATTEETAKFAVPQVGLCHLYHLQTFHFIAVTSCPVTLTNTTGVIRSMAYPQSYPSNSDCQYRLQLPGNTGDQIRILFQADDMHTECRRDEIVMVNESYPVYSGTMETVNDCGPMYPNRKYECKV